MASRAIQYCTQNGSTFWSPGRPRRHQGSQRWPQELSKTAQDEPNTAQYDLKTTQHRFEIASNRPIRFQYAPRRPELIGGHFA
eukprot:8140790-Pyramimonas_sp.AAC.1